MMIWRVVKWSMLLLVLALLAFLLLYKPVRVFYPQANGLTCPSEILCIDDLSRLAMAKQLVETATQTINTQFEPLSFTPKFIFCSTQACFESFGFRHAAAQTFGDVGTVVGPRGWRDYYIRHELIHQWQADKLGNMGVVTAPTWVIEGMAYALSDDPRQTLSEPWQSHRQQFEQWYDTINKQHLVVELKQFTQ